MNWQKVWDWFNIVFPLFLAVMFAETAFHTDTKAAWHGFLAGFLVMLALKELARKYGDKQ